MKLFKFEKDAERIRLYICGIKFSYKPHKKISIKNPNKGKNFIQLLAELNQKSKYYKNFVNKVKSDIVPIETDAFRIPFENKIKLENYTKKIGYMDKLGCVLEKDGEFYRGIYPESVERFEKFYKTGILQALIKNNLVVETEVTNFYTDEFPVILKSKKIDCMPPNYWTFSKIKEVAINTTLILQILNKTGYTLCDGHSFNTGFDDDKAKWFDIGSFISGSVVTGPKNDIIKFHLCELMMMTLPKKFLLTYKLAYTLDCGDLNGGTEFNKSIEFKSLIKEFKKYYKSPMIDLIVFNMFSLKNIKPEDIDVLFKFVDVDTNWSDYYVWDKKLIAETMKTQNRFSRIVELVKEYAQDAQSSVDLAGNSGFMSALLAENTNIKKIVSTDYDQYCIEHGIEYCKASNINLKFALLNFMLPLEEQRAYSEFKSDLVLALAVTHHLILSQEFNIDAILEITKKYTNKYVFIEFCPLGMWSSAYPDSLPDVPDFYSEDWFEEHFKKYFNLLHKEVLSTVEIAGETRNHRVMYIGKI